MKYSFISGKEYTRKEVKSIIGHPVPNSVGGIWGTGYASFDDSYFIFANINVAGRTGHDYNNILTDNSLYWYSKNTDSIHTPTLKKMLSGEHKIYIFTRYDNSLPQFTFQGLGYVKDYTDQTPAHIVWGFAESNSKNLLYKTTQKRRKFLEGAKGEYLTTRYERDKCARKACLDYYGYNCVVCDFNFEETYGEIGKNFIHVHHLKEISSIGMEYEIDPIKDLRPVCPNCHAMIHKKKPAYTIEEIEEILE